MVLRGYGKMHPCDEEWFNMVLFNHEKWERVYEDYDVLIDHLPEDLVFEIFKYRWLPFMSPRCGECLCIPCELGYLHNVGGCSKRCEFCERFYRIFF